MTVMEGKMTELTQVLLDRREEIRVEKLNLDQRSKALSEESVLIDKHLQILGVEVGRKVKSGARTSVRDEVLRVLGEADRGLTVNELCAAGNFDIGVGGVRQALYKLETAGEVSRTTVREESGRESRVFSLPLRGLANAA